MKKLAFMRAFLLGKHTIALAGWGVGFFKIFLAFGVQINGQSQLIIT